MSKGTLHLIGDDNFTELGRTHPIYGNTRCGDVGALTDCIFDISCPKCQDIYRGECGESGITEGLQKKWDKNKKRKEKRENKAILSEIERVTRYRFCEVKDGRVTMLAAGYPIPEELIVGIPDKDGIYELSECTYRGAGRCSIGSPNTLYNAYHPEANCGKYSIDPRPISILLGLPDVLRLVNRLLISWRRGEAPREYTVEPVVKRCRDCGKDILHNQYGECTVCRKTHCSTEDMEEE